MRRRSGAGRCAGWSAFFFFQAEDGIRDYKVTGVQTCALPISVAQGDVAQGFSPEDSAAIAGSSETPRTEPAAEKNPWSAWAWLGTCRTREEKIGRASCRERV